MTKVQYMKYERKNMIRGEISKEEKRGILYPECRIGKKKLW